MTDRLDLLDYYTLLGVDPNAEAREIRDAFRKFARRYHPDRFAGDDERLARSTQIYRRGSEALQILTNPVSRRAYDRLLRLGKVRLGADDRDRAELDERRARAEQSAAAPASPIRSPQAAAFYERSAAAARTGQWREAWRLMKSAVDAEPDNELLRARLNQIESRLRTAR
ncbi:MAG: DnaJ domain-containing protein [Sandaracinaceae bacterium]|nr:DnaJ domain-containing protein [Sandaracinaceae bacterium]